MSSGSQPTPPSPTQSAQAQASSQLAGQMFQAENQPVLGYEDALTRSMFSPYENNLASSLSANSALQAAQANQAIKYQADPALYQAQQMALQGANARMGALYGVNPSSYSYSSPGAFAYPSTSMLPSLGSVGASAQAIAKHLGSVNIGDRGQVTLLPPGSYGQG